MSEPPVFLITGASTGIGQATARHAAAAGHRLALLARSTDKLEELATALGGPERALALTCDVTEWDQVEQAVTATTDAFGRIDVVFANAGFGAARGLLSESPEHWRSMVLTNVYGAAITMRATVPALRRSEGHLLVTGSVAGHVPIEGSVYSATKHAVVALAESARKELCEHGVRVTVISPGNVDTPFFENTPPVHLTGDDVARAVMFAVTQPAGVGINEIVMRHPRQAI